MLTCKWVLATTLGVIPQGRIQDFKLGGALKQIAPSGGKRENIWGISCEKSRFYAKKSYFFQLRREAQNLLGYFVWKITILRQKIIFFPSFQKRCTRHATASDKVYQLLAHGRWFSMCTPSSSTTKTGRHNIAEILLKVALNTKNVNIF
jgi:hypothetical protein